MSKTAWTREGKLLVDDLGRVIVCEECPCDSYPFVASSSECNQCDPGTTPAWRYFRIGGVTGPDAAAWNRVHTVPQYGGGCEWSGQDPDLPGSARDDVDTIPALGAIHSYPLGNGNYSINVYEATGQLVAVFGRAIGTDCSQPYGVFTRSYGITVTNNWTAATLEDIGQD